MSKKKFIIFKSNSGSGHFYTLKKNIKKNYLVKYDPIFRKHFLYLKL
ncbi:50S ribosomal protein L33 [Candidatus Vidania fulgoroideorum]